ncbi:hypothetical protein [Mangrovimonas aestuarii]|uniref:hypothetical protein n=1 Tax=Mangrovimonas aestuarii TaxID=3018443 RepID=UPI002378A56F|nr:hypothetical protein [Mangrovimonas aestuarii]
MKRITVAEATDLSDNWTNTRQAAVDRAAGKPDNRSVWCSLDDLRQFLDDAENEAKANGYDMDGVRIYLGVYGEEQLADKAGYTTMFLTATGKKTDTTDPTQDLTDIDPFNDGMGGNPPQATYPQ